MKEKKREEKKWKNEGKMNRALENNGTPLSPPTHA